MEQVHTYEIGEFNMLSLKLMDNLVFAVLVERFSKWKKDFHGISLFLFFQLVL